MPIDPVAMLTRVEYAGFWLRKGAVSGDWCRSAKYVVVYIEILTKFMSSTVNNVSPECISF